MYGISNGENIFDLSPQVTSKGQKSRSNAKNFEVESGMLTRPQRHEAEATTQEAEATTHEAEATTHEAEAEARFFGLEAEARPRTAWRTCKCWVTYLITIQLDRHSGQTEKVER